jgi:dipeptidyl aminopeptidase/acylaminoacyl peptidase
LQDDRPNNSAGQDGVAGRVRALGRVSWLDLKIPTEPAHEGPDVVHALGGWLLVLGLMQGDFEGRDDLRTVAEQSDFKATARSDEVVALCKRLAAAAPVIRYDEIGLSTEGRRIPLLIVADPPVATPEAAAKSGKLVVLLVGNIHAGEVCGKEALPILAREVAQAPALLKDIVLVIVPNINPDGNERVNTQNRPGQVGPERGMGQRANARGLDLNRDFVKLETPEIRALVRCVNRWDPHIFIDTHTTNGSHHRYVMTYMGPQNPAGDPAVLEYVRTRLLPAAESLFEQATGQDAFFYGNFDRGRTSWTSFPPTPRFGTNYVGIRNRIAILTEAYAYAPYKARVLATRDFVRACLAQAAGRKDEILKLLDSARKPRKADGSVALAAEAKALPEPATILGFVEEEKDGRRVPTDQPKEYKVDLVQDYRPTRLSTRPQAYLVPARFVEAIATLQRHGLDVAELTEDIELDVETYRITKRSRSERTFEGHSAVRLQVEPRGDKRMIEAGTVIVRADQPLGNLAVYLLEPESEDGLATWNFFDAELAEGADFPVLRMKEGSPATVAARPLPEDRGSSRAVATGAPGAGGGRRGRGDGQMWLDGEHMLQVKDGRLISVAATTGRTSVFFETDALEKALAAVPGVAAETARSMARRTTFTMNPGRTGALFEHRGDLYYATFDGTTAARLTDSPQAEELASFSPDGKVVAFIRANDLYAVDIESLKERALTTGGTDRLRNGKADWVYFEEIFNRNSRAYWWSPDSSRIAFLQFDDAPVREHLVINDAGDARVVEPTPYPRSGDPNPKVKLGLVEAGGGPVLWADLSSYPEGSWLISHVGWWPDGRAAIAHVQDRTQTWLDFVRIPADGGSPKALFRETTKAWVESPGDPRFLGDGSFLLASERDGWKHLYLFAPDGTVRRQVTSGAWEVRSVEYVDEPSSWVYFTATKDNPVAANLYRVKLEGGSIERVTSGAGSHSIAMSPDGRYFVDTWSDPETPPRRVLCSADGLKVRTLDSNPAYGLVGARAVNRRRMQIRTKDGFVLEAEVLTPLDLDPEHKRYPVWFTTYGGPHAPTVSDTFGGGRGFESTLVNEGFIVFRMDPRSASGKGAVSTWTAYKRLGVQELGDIKEGIAWLLHEYPCADPARIGMSGHSYGGFMTSFAMTHSDLFAAGIAGAPVTDWRDYDSIYTERYMGTPQENPEGYAASSVVGAASNLHGRLLLAHGGSDDNVSLRNTMHLVQALQEAGKDFELMIYPSSRHGIMSPHYRNLQLDFVRRTLGGPRDRN